MLALGSAIKGFYAWQRVRSVGMAYSKLVEGRKQTHTEPTQLNPLSS